jgi:hypothetical protein
MHLPAGFLGTLRQRLEELLTINIIEKNVLSPVAPVHHVIDRARILHSHRPRHGTSLTAAVPVVKRQPGGEEQANLWFDPFPERDTKPVRVAVWAILV